MSLAPRGSLSLLGALGLVLLATVLTFALAGAAAGIEALLGPAALGDAFRSVLSNPRLVSFLLLGGFMTAAFAGVLLAHGQDVRYRDALGFRPVSTVVGLLALATGLCLQFPLHEVANLIAAVAPGLAPNVETQVAMRNVVAVNGIEDALLVPLTVVAIPAVSEELLFRGVLLPGLTKRYNEPVGLIASALLFGLVHVDPLAVGYATVAGLLLGHIRLRTGSIVPCIAVHGAFNAVPVLLPEGLVRIDGFNTVSETIEHLPLPLVLGCAVVVGISVTAMTRLSGRQHD